jgi:heme iron utilization protein
MNAANAEALRSLVQGQRIASLGTLHDGEPYVSMVPYAVLPDGSGLVIHVSGLSAHTSDMAASPRVSVMIMAADAPGALAQSLPRVTIQADGERLAATGAGHGPAREAYVARFPHAARIFELPDFSLFVLRPVSLRLVAGFAQAVTLPAGALAEALGAG